MIHVDYDSDYNPTVIRQNWQAGNGAGAAQNHVYATFNYTYTPINPNFGSLTVYGPSGVYIKALQSIVYADNSSTRFDYNAYGQVRQVSNHAADGHKLNHAAVNLSDGDLTAQQADCPRFTQTKTYAENFNNNQETIVTNSVPANAAFTPPGGTSEAASVIAVAMTGHPNNLISKTYVGSSGWKEGLPIATEDCVTTACTGADRKRWTWTNWTQDNIALTYIQNPRVTETKVGDTTNTKRTTVSYHAQFGLVNEVKVYDTDQTTELKKSVTAYNLASAYVSRRIIGLPSQSEFYGSDGTALSLMSKVTYLYDEGDFSDTALSQNIAAVRHDSTNYGASFIIGRGNLTSTTRHDVTGQTAAVTSSVKYNTAGAAVAQITPGSATGTTRTVKIGYADVFNDGQNGRNTFAYPTKITDPAGNFSAVKYRFDTGANVWAKSPTPQGSVVSPNLKGKETERIFFDSTGKLEREKIVNNGAYTRYEYPTNGVQNKVFSTLTAGAGEAESESWTDGAGRIRRSRTEHPGSAGGWSGSMVEYDILGRVKRSTVPTEINANYEPAGDDYVRGWLWQSQEYDWKSRVTREINIDGTDKLINYQGCGCSGNEVITIQNELVPRDDQPTISARRTQKIYADAQGRNWKTEEMKWDGTTPYLTTTTQFDGRDQATSITQNNETGSQTQLTILTYDGHGRVKTQKLPEQDSPTTYNYSSDDSISSVVDGRGATTSYTYNNRGLITLIGYEPPSGSTIPDTPDTTFSYDAAGNRTQMADSSGTTDYQYNELSQITSETKQFSGLADTFTLGYEYALNGAVKKLDILPNNTSVSYIYDKIGRVNSVTGQGFLLGTTPITNIVSSINYRAWSNVKSINYGNSLNMNLTYDNNLKVASFRIPTFMEMDYQYNADGRVKFADNLLDGKFDRSYSYDHMQRLVTAKTGEQANGGTNMTGPYNQSYGFDAFSNSTSRNTVHWTEQFSFQSSYTNNRRNGWQYDANGNVAAFDNITNTFDAAEMNTKVTYPAQFEGNPQYDNYRTNSEKVLNYDGDGQTTIEFSQTDKHKYNGEVYSRHESHNEDKEYNLKSTVLGGAIVFKYSISNGWRRNGPYTETTAYSRYETNLFLHGKLLAVMTWQPLSDPNWSHNFEWRHTDPMATTLGISGMDYKRLEAVFDPVGADVKFDNPYIDPNPPPEPLPFRGEFASPEATEMVEVDGVLTPLYMFPGMASIVSQCPRSGCGPIRTENGFEYWTAFADGYEGYLPMGGQFGQQDKDKKKRVKPKLKVVPKGTPRRAVNPADFEKPIQTPMNIDSPDFANESLDASLTKVLNLINLTVNNVNIVGFNDTQEKLITDSLFWMLYNKPCADAFRAAKLPTPAERLRNHPLVIAHADILNSSDKSLQIGINEDARLVSQSNLQNEGIPAFTTDKPYKGKNYMFLKESAFEGTIAPFSETFPHETMHASGAPSRKYYGLFLGVFRYGHDLTRWENYEGVIKNCRLQ